MSSLRWNAIIPASAGAGLFDIETRLSILEQPPEHLGQSSKETRIVLLEASAIAATAAVCATRSLLQERFLDVEERIAEIHEVIRSPLVEESLGVDETVPTHESFPPVPLLMSRSFSRGAASFQTICKNNDTRKKLSVFSVPTSGGLSQIATGLTLPLASQFISYPTRFERFLSISSPSWVLSLYPTN